ncbi:MAG: Dipicolinate synthase subunit A [Syntrophomonadaceae bacterium]|nr:Dipicolinate synthase subunit A [Bacillota bacterium]
MELQGLNILIAGGDKREMVLAAALAERGAKIWLHGFEEYPLLPEAEINKGLPEQSDVIICPLAGSDDKGNIFAPFSADPCTLDGLRQQLFCAALLICGRLPAHYLQELNKAGVRVFLSGEDDELAILNAVPTAEGALELAMRESSVTIHDSECLVIGFGRCGQPLARTLQGLGAKVTVAARSPEARAQAWSHGFGAIGMDALTGLAEKSRFIFNTVPALVLTAEVLEAANRAAVIIDIASRPGGTDFAAAGRLGIKSFLAPGLPGLAAPETAGKILARVYLPLICLRGRRVKK